MRSCCITFGDFQCQTSGNLNPLAATALSLLIPFFTFSPSLSLIPLSFTILFPLSSLPHHSSIPSSPLPSQGPIPLFQLGDLGSAVSSPSGSRQSLATKRFAAHFELKPRCPCLRPALFAAVCIIKKRPVY